MSDRSAAEVTVPELIAEFRRLAGQLGSHLSLSVKPERYRRTPERAARVARMNVLTPEMRLRASAQTLKTLMENADDDVRTWAMMRFDEVDPDLASAASAGLAENVSTREAQNLIEHARTPPLPLPSLTEMSLDEVVARFTDACLREFWARHCGRGDDPFDVELGNKISGEIAQIVPELRRRGACDRLLPLLGSANITQRAEAARATFEIAPELALKTLEEVAASKDVYEFGRADQSLQSFRGRLANG